MPEPLPDWVNQSVDKGAADFLNSVELRTPPIVAPIVNDNLSAVFFHDMGNAFDTTGQPDVNERVTLAVLCPQP